MKTFLTEKNNIPEGATHYQEPDAQHVFAWFKLDGNKLSIKVPVLGEDSDWDDCNLDYYKGKIKPIPKPEVVEWQNGDACVWGGVDAVFIGYSHSHKSRCAIEYLRDYCSVIDNVFIDALEKPENPEQKLERERLEVAYDLYCDYCAGFGVAFCSFEMFCDSEMQSKVWLAIVDKTNYRKGE